MDKVINSQEENLFELSEIPRFLYNKELTDNQRKRLASGRQTELIRDIVIDRNSPPIDAKVTAIKNEEGKLELSYDYAEKQFTMPGKIFGQALTAEQKDKLFEGELISVAYRGSDYFVGLDRELNKITVKSGRQIGIPEQVADYKLTTEDKLNLANGKAMDTRLYATPEGDYFTARLKFTDDRQGIEFGEIKFVSRENVIELREKYNTPSNALENTLNLAKSIVESNSIEQNRSVNDISVSGASQVLPEQPYTINLQVTEGQKNEIAKFYELGEGTNGNILTKEQAAMIPDRIGDFELTDRAKHLLAYDSLPLPDGTLYRIEEDGKLTRTEFGEDSKEIKTNVKSSEIKFLIETGADLSKTQSDPIVIKLEVTDQQKNEISKFYELGEGANGNILTKEQAAMIPDRIADFDMTDRAKHLLAYDSLPMPDGTLYRIENDGKLSRTEFGEDSKETKSEVTVSEVRYYKEPAPELNKDADNSFIIKLEITDQQRNNISKFNEVGEKRNGDLLTKEQLDLIPDKLDGVTLDKRSKTFLAYDSLVLNDGTKYSIEENGSISKTTYGADHVPEKKTLTFQEVGFDQKLDSQLIAERFPASDKYRGLGKDIYEGLLDFSRQDFESYREKSGGQQDFFMSRKKDQEAQIDYALNNFSGYKNEIRSIISRSADALEKVSDTYSNQDVLARFPKSDPYRGLGKEMYEELKDLSHFDYSMNKSTFSKVFSAGGVNEEKQMDWALKNFSRYETAIVHSADRLGVAIPSDLAVRKDFSVESIYEKFVPSQHPIPPAPAIEARDIKVIDPVVLGEARTKDISQINVVDPVYEVKSEKQPVQETEGRTDNAGAAKEKRPIIEYTDVKANETGFTIKATEYFVPDNLKGVKLSEKQKDDLSKGEKIYVEGMTIKGQKTNAYVSINGNGGGISFDFDREKKAKSGKDIGKKQQKDDLNLGR